MSILLIVESPTKAKTIRKFLSKDIRVMASMGHIRDLPDKAADIPTKYKKEPWARLGVNVEKNFEPIYVIPKTKSKIVRELKEALESATEVILATDEDREGESISWHLVEALKPKMPIKRMVFHEITQEAIQEALRHCRVIDDKLVRAQETRRILDRLVGYTLSPLLWKKIAYGLSAGRVQSVAVRLIVMRERERRAFCKAAYWDIKAHLSFQKSAFEAMLVGVDGKRVATGRDFDPKSGLLLADKKSDVTLLDEATTKQLSAQLQTEKWTVDSLEEKPVTRRPSPPFTTSTLQQEANRKLRMSAKETMRTAQRLYEEGYITYMRTDSVFLSAQAISGARECVDRLYGKEFLSDSPRQFETKSKGAQEAHEAIRPAGAHFKTPQETGLTGRELALYDLIWKRTVASQMAEAKQTHITATITAGHAQFRATGKRIDFPGFFRAYVEGSDDPESAIDGQEVWLPAFKAGDPLDCQSLEPLRHETLPPARYTEATLVKALEADGIGRPSTYASIISTIQDRGYVNLTGNALIPTFTAFSVVGLLERHFPKLVDIGFTASMENTLDDIAEGKTEWLPYLKQFYLGNEGLQHEVTKHETTIEPDAAKTVDLGGEKLGVTIKIGRFGPYFEKKEGETSQNASIPAGIPPADLNDAMIEEIFKNKSDGPQSLGSDPTTHEPIFVLTGAYGPYVQRGDAAGDDAKPKRVSLPKGMTPDMVTMPIALRLLELPKLLGEKDGGRVEIGIGRFGPYVVHTLGGAKDYRSIKPAEKVLTITLEEALALLAEEKVRGRGRSASKTALRELGEHPEDKAPVAIFDGPYGPYVKHGKVNASLPKDTDVAIVTMEEAVELLAAKKATKTKGRRKKSS